MASVGADLSAPPTEIIPTVMSQAFERVRGRPLARLAVLWMGHPRIARGGDPEGFSRSKSMSWDLDGSGDGLGHDGTSVDARGRGDHADHVRPVRDLAD